MIWPQFLGGSAQSRSGAIDNERCVNLYLETVESTANPKKAYLIGTPGTKPRGSVTDAPGRGIFTQDGRTWEVIGGALYETMTPFTAIYRGGIPDDGQPVSMASNGDGGNQLAIVGGGELKILNLLTNVLSAAILLPLTNRPVMVAFLDRYFLLLEDNSLRFWFSALEDGTNWDGLDFVTRAITSDRLVALIVAFDRVWTFGSETSDAWEEVSDADNPFQPIHGSTFPIGCQARWSVQAGADTIRWLGSSGRGGAVVYRLNGYTGQRISTHGIETALAGYPQLSDAEAMTFHQEGHHFYALTCPSGGPAGVTWVWDETEQLWHQRSYWNQALAREEAWRARGHAYVGTEHLVGSRNSGELWTLDLDTYDDAGALLRSVRRAPYLGDENQWLFLDQFELGIETGGGLNMGQGSDPQAVLNISKNNGKTWFQAGMAPLGKMGEYLTRCIWRKLGRVRLDRLVVEVVITDPVKRVLSGAWLRARPGTGQL